ncbi:hypothetical protein HUU62_13025 [Rhodoferax sp. 4810]|nr:hypothetical protein [Rhodoferax jenense]
MTTEPEPSKTLSAAHSVVGLLTQIAALTAGASVLGLIAGWREAIAYFSSIGASWFVTSLTPIMLLERSAVLMAILAISAFFSIYSISQGETSAKGLRWASLALLIIALPLVNIAVFGDEFISKKLIYFCTLLGGVALAASAGTTIGEVVARLADDQLKWNGYHAWLLYFVASFALIQAPDRLGRAQAQFHIDPVQSALPVVQLAVPSPDKTWRLVALSGSQFLLVSLSEKESGRTFRVVDANAISEIRAGNVTP